MWSVPNSGMHGFGAVPIPPTVVHVPLRLKCFHDATCLAAGRVAQPRLLPVKDAA